MPLPRQQRVMIGLQRRHQLARNLRHVPGSSAPITKLSQVGCGAGEVIAAAKRHHPGG